MPPLNTAWYAIGLVGVTACGGPDETDLPLAELPEGLHLKVNGRGYALDEDWGPTSASRVSCVRRVGKDSVEVAAYGPLPGASGMEHDYLELILCQVDRFGGEAVAANQIEDGQIGCYAEPLWAGSFRDSDRRVNVRTDPRTDAEQSECLMQAEVNDDFVARFFCPWWGDVGRERVDPVTISGWIRCPLEFAE